MDGLPPRQTCALRLSGAILLLCLMTACAAYPGDIAREGLTAEALAAIDDDNIGLNWYSADSPRAVIVLVHGLNLDPLAMTDIAQVLYENDMDVLSVSLRGHAPELSEEGRLLQFQEVAFSSWQDDINKAINVASQRALLDQIPLYLVGFSLGGLLSADYLLHGASPDSATVERMVLFAPAISLRWSSYMLYPLQVIPEVFLPSMAPMEYRANDFAPVSAYLALYDGVRQFNEGADQRLNIPTLIFMHPRDELVSTQRVRDFIETHVLSEWRFVSVSKGDDAANVMNHLIISEDSMGTEAWRLVSNQMLEFLR